jgi:hypothetical protein
MAAWAKIAAEFKSLLRLKTEHIVFRRLDKIKNIVRITYGFTYCQVPFLVRVMWQAVGITKHDPIGVRCTRIHGLRQTTEKSMQIEAEMLSHT